MFNTYLPGFLHWLRFEKRYSPHTITSYETDLEKFGAYLQREYSDLISLKDITHYHIRSWLAELKDKNQQSSATLNRKISTLNSFYKHLQRQGITDQNPVRKLHALRVPERLPVYLKHEETQKLLEEEAFTPDFKGKTDRLICELLYNTGMRRQELINLKHNDIEWSLRQIRVLGKGNKERLIPVSEVILDSLRDYISTKKEIENADPQQLLILESGQPVYAVYVYRVVTSYLNKVSSLQKKSPHVMRHTFATHLLNNGANIQAIKDLLGHSSLAATQVYTHNNIDQLKEIHRKAHPREKKGKDKE
jgi:integrase/recombinase XerC